MQVGGRRPLADAGSLREQNGEAEGRAAARLAGDRELAAHAGDETARDGEPEPGSLVAARGGSVDLLELLEDAVEPVGRDPRTGVGDGEADAIAVARHAHADAALVGELHRVAGEVQDHLAQACRVPHHLAAEVAADQAGDLDALALRARRQELDGALDQRRQVEGLLDQVELSRLDLREVEDLVEDRQQRLARCPHRLDIGLLFQVDPRGEQEVRHAENAVQRRADLVADGGQEAGLGLVGGLGLAPGLREFGLGEAAVGDVATHPLGLPSQAAVLGMGLDP